MNPKEFTGLALKEFHFLENEFNFIVSEKHIGFVRFASSNVTIGVAYDPRGSELDLYFRKVPDEQEYTFSEIVRAMKVETELIVGCPSLPDKEALVRYLKGYAKILKKHCCLILEGNVFVFKQLELQRESECESYRIEKVLEFTRRDAEEVWRNKEFAKFVEIMEPVLDHLKKSERLKVNYAKKKLLI